MEKLISFRFYGNYAKANLVNPYSVTESLLSQRILLEIAKEEKDSKTISKEIDVNEKYVIDTLNHLMRAGIVNRTADRYISSILVVKKDEKQPIIGLGNALGKQEAGILQNEVLELKGVYEKTQLSGQGFAWSDVDYMILAGFVLDLGMNSVLRKHKMIPSPPQRVLYVNDKPFVNGQYWFWGMEDGWDAKRSFGVNLFFVNNGGFGWIWSPSVVRFQMHLDETDFGIMHELGSKSKLAELKTSGTNSIKIKGRLLKLKYKGLIKQVNEPCLTFPFLVQEDINLLERSITRICDFLVERVLTPHIEAIHKSFQMTGKKRKNLDYGEFFGMFNRIVMDYCLDALVGKQVLPELTRFAPPNWGFWAWRGESAILNHNVFL